MKQFFTFVLLLTTLFIAGCGNSAPRPMSEEELVTYNQLKEKASKVEYMLDDISTMEAKEALALLEMANQLNYTYDYQELDSLSQIKCQGLADKIESVKEKIIQTVHTCLPNISVEVVSNSDCLLENTVTYPIYLQRGEKLHVNISTQRTATVKVYNYDAKSTIKTINNKTAKFSIDITNAAIYLVEINPGKSSQYASLHISYNPKSIERLTPTVVNEREVEARAGEFRVRTVKGIKLKNLLDEPRKFTLRGQLKAMFSGSYRGVVAVEVPKGATDILYSMRISTNERDRSSDGEFDEKANASYHNIKMLGLPVYESTRSAGIINTILGDYTPLREEDAYINMFVFSSSSQAKKFQDDKPTNQLSYDVNSSIMGMQSSNGRIPVKGRSTIYLGFENERTRYNNYVWVELLASQPVNEYFKTEYYID